MAAVSKNRLENQVSSGRSQKLSVTSTATQLTEISVFLTHQPEDCATQQQMARSCSSKRRKSLVSKMQTLQEDDSKETEKCPKVKENRATRWIAPKCLT